MVLDLLASPQVKTFHESSSEKGVAEVRIELQINCEENEKKFDDLCFAPAAPFFHFVAVDYEAWPASDVVVARHTMRFFVLA